MRGKYRHEYMKINYYIGMLVQGNLSVAMVYFEEKTFFHELSLWFYRLVLATFFEDQMPRSKTLHNSKYDLVLQILVHNLHIW